MYASKTKQLFIYSFDYLSYKHKTPQSSTHTNARGHVVYLFFKRPGKVPAYVDK